MCYKSQLYGKAVLAIDIAAKSILCTVRYQQKEHGPCHQYNAWAWPEKQNLPLVATKED